MREPSATTALREMPLLNRPNEMLSRCPILGKSNGDLQRRNQTLIGESTKRRSGAVAVRLSLPIAGRHAYDRGYAQLPLLQLLTTSDPPYGVG